MHHRKGWVNKLREPLYKLKLTMEIGKIKKRCRTEWVRRNKLLMILKVYGGELNDSCI